MAEGNKVILDVWSPLNHKTTMQGSQRVAPDTGMAPTWVGEHQRRLNAYITLDAYLKNVSRSWLLSKDRELRREYGDAALVRDVLRGAVLGNEFGISLDGSEWDAPPDPRDEDDPDPVEVEHFEKEWAHWQSVTRQQHWFDRWAQVEQLDQKIIDNENKTIGYGDSVMVLSWSNARNRVRVRTYDPGFYFPVFDDDSDDFPERVHIAWEFEEPDPVSGNLTTFVRRMTWELIDAESPMTFPYPSTADNLELDPEESVHTQLGHSAAHTGGADPKGDSTGDKVCVMSDGVWKVADIVAGVHVDDLTDGTAQWQLNADGEELYRYDLGIDFIPVVHFPNTVALEERWGESSLLRIAQLLDDIHAADSDLASASALVGTPPMLVSGWEGQEKLTTYGPGTLFGVGDGDMKILDTSKSLDALIQHVSRLLERLAVNRQIPDAIFGRVDAADVPSGVSLLLSFAPFQQHISELRLARTEKYCLLVKFVQRLARVGGQLDAVYDGCIQFGSYLPSDVASTVTMIETLVQGEKPVMSRATALRLLQEAGIGIEDVDIELQRVRSEDFAGAARLADSTADEAAARAYLGLDGDDEAETEAVGPPPTVEIPDEDLP